MLFQKKRRNLESGQVIYIVALLAIVLVAFIGLAIDGGNNLLTQRDEVTSADAAAWSGINLYCFSSSERYLTERLTQLLPQPRFEEYLQLLAQDGSQADQVIQTEIAHLAALNGYVDGENNVTNTANIDRQENTITVTIRKDLPKYFIQLVYWGDWFAQRLAVTKANCNRIRQLDGSIIALDHRNGEGFWCDNALSITGSNSDIDGAYSGNDFFSSGSTIDVGVCAFNGDDNRNVNTVCTTTEAPSDPVTEDDLPLVNLTDYAWGGIEALNAGGDYHYVDGNLSYNPASEVCLGNGLWYVTGDVRINCSIPVGTHFTLVALGSVDISTNLVLDVKPYTNNILIYSAKKTACVQDAIKISVSQSYLEGLIMAPWGSCQFSASKTTVTGSVICNTVKVSSSDSTFTFNEDYKEQLPHIFWLAE